MSTDTLDPAEARFALIGAYARAVRPLVTLSLNAPARAAREAEDGEPPLPALLDRLFARGLDLLDARGVAGPPRLVDGTTRFALIGAPGRDARELKEALLALEEGRPEGRLYDFDVIDDPSGMPRSREAHGLPPRACLVCGGETLACRREGRHGAAELATAARRLLRGAALGGPEPREREIAALGAAALAFELLVEPKPGLVCPGSSGVHRDMNAFTFARSLATFPPWLADCARAGATHAGGEEPLPLYERLKARGLQADAAMFRATGGVNTHKGLVYSLGLLAAGAGQAGASGLPLKAEEVASAAGGIAAAGVARELSGIARRGAPSTRGERVYLATGRAGPRGEAAAGFPTVLAVAMPRLREAADDFAMNDAGGRALEALLSACDDTNLLGKDAASLEPLRDLARRAAAAGEARTELAAFLHARGLSPGGAADLLACGFFLLLLERRFGDGRPA